MNRLQAIENNIIAITGKDTSTFSDWAHIRSEREQVKGLLAERRNILNNMFVASDEAMQRFWTVNNHLFTLTQRLFVRFAGMEHKMATVMDCPDWDDDSFLEGWLRFVFNDKGSVLNLPDDKTYGSRFTLMIKTLYELYCDSGIENIESVYQGSKPLDDGQSWGDEAPFRGRDEFDNIIICHAVHDLCDHKLYSIPDLLRLNDFWCEVRLSAQSITSQDGTRWKPQDL